MEEMRITVIAEQTGATVQPVTREAVSFARELETHTGGFVQAIVLGDPVESLAHSLAETTGVDVTGFESANLALYNGEVYRNTLLKFLETDGPAVICLPHTAFGFDLAPRLAIALHASCITAVEEIRFSNGRVRFVRSMFNGKLQAEVATSREKIVVTLLPGAWPGHERFPGSRKHQVRIIKSDVFPTASQTLEVREASNEPLNFDDADVIVAAGRGIRNAKNLKLLENLAAIFPKAGLGASRAVCDLGWLGYRHQIGITGQTVSPRLYIACGISGAMQHLAGMKESRIIVAINNDPHAAIFQVADLGIVENLETFIPILLAEFKRQ
jgi:electron transfer flavoprotein alpha subunit